MPRWVDLETEAREVAADPPGPSPASTRRGGPAAKGGARASSRKRDAPAESVLVYLGRQSDSSWTPDRLPEHVDTARLGVALAAELSSLGYQVTVAGHVAEQDTLGLEFVPDDRLAMTDAPSDAPGAPREPAYDHVVISRFVAQFALKHPIVARLGVYACMLDVVPSSLLWVRPATSPTMSGDGAQALIPNATWTTPDLVSVSGLASFANALPRIDRIMVNSEWHAREMRKRILALGVGVSTDIHLYPVALDVAKWRQRAEAFVERGEKKVRLRFLHCCDSRVRSVADMLALFPSIRALIPGASLAFLTMGHDPLPAEVRQAIDAIEWASCSTAGDFDEVLRAEVLMYAPTVQDVRHQPLLEMMLANILAIVPKRDSLPELVTPDRGILVDSDAHGRSIIDIPLLKHVLVDEPSVRLPPPQTARARCRPPFRPLSCALACARPQLRAGYASAAKSWAEMQTHEASAKAFDTLFEEQRRRSAAKQPPSPARPASSSTPSATNDDGVSSNEPSPPCPHAGGALRSGMLVFGGWIAGSVWLFIAGMRRRVAAPPAAAASSVKPPASGGKHHEKKA